MLKTIEFEGISFTKVDFLNFLENMNWDGKITKHEYKTYTGVNYRYIFNFLGSNISMTSCNNPFTGEYDGGTTREYLKNTLVYMSLYGIDTDSVLSFIESLRSDLHIKYLSTTGKSTFGNYYPMDDIESIDTHYDTANVEILDYNK